MANEGAISNEQLKSGRAAELKDLPEEFWDMVAELYSEVEQTGVWPDPLQGALVAMLEKGGTEDPAEKRPICLLSAFYRLWADGSDESLSP